MKQIAPSVSWHALGQILGIILLGSPLIFYAKLHLSRPSVTNARSALFPGATYSQQIDRSLPRPVSIHVVEIDLKVPGLEVVVTPPQGGKPPHQIKARTTTEFLTEFDLQLAVNANFFYLFREKTPWDYYPKSGEGVNLVGLAMAEGKRYDNNKSKFPALCLNSANRAEIANTSECPLGTVSGIAGNEIIVDGGRPIAKSDSTSFYNKPYPRTAIATNRNGDKLWLFVIDGKQPFYSEGVTIPELTKIILRSGADRALNLDGGGSTTLAVAAQKGARLLNSPIQNKLPMNERPVANHLGFKVRSQPIGRN